MRWVEFPFKLGDRVHGVDARGNSFTGTVTRLVGPFSVELDRDFITPASLITGWPTVQSQKE